MLFKKLSYFITFSTMLTLAYGATSINIQNLSALDRVSLKVYCGLSYFPFFWMDKDKCSDSFLLQNNINPSDIINNSDISLLYNSNTSVVNTEPAPINNNINTNSNNADTIPTNTINNNQDFTSLRSRIDTLYNIVANLSLPATGPQGPQGPAGPQGEAGLSDSNAIINTQQPSQLFFPQVINGANLSTNSGGNNLSYSSGNIGNLVTSSINTDNLTINGDLSLSNSAENTIANVSASNTINNIDYTGGILTSN
ncbi:MAG: hypothetical protein QG614_84, partial [Patescibacteria group bacterium]|nr:hypothetical protein [Patescibacteria group bacterium]